MILTSLLWLHGSGTPRCYIDGGSTKRCGAVLLADTSNASGTLVVLRSSLLGCDLHSLGSIAPSQRHSLRALIRDATGDLGGYQRKPY